MVFFSENKNQYLKLYIFIYIYARKQDKVKIIIIIIIIVEILLPSSQKLCWKRIIFVTRLLFFSDLNNLFSKLTSIIINEFVCVCVCESVSVCVCVCV